MNVALENNVNIAVKLGRNALAICISSVPSWADPDGITGRSLNTSTGCGTSGCHNVIASETTTVTLLQATNGKLSVEIGKTISLTLRVAHDQKLAAGANISVRTQLQGQTYAGTLTAVSGGGLKVRSQELVHSSPKTMVSGAAEFTFQWKAPLTPGVYYIHAVGNAVNLNGDNDVNGNIVKQESFSPTSDLFLYQWNGTSNQGFALPAGSYFVAIVEPRKVTTGTILWLPN